MTMPTLVATDTSPFLNVSFPANIEGYTAVVVTWRIDAGPLVTAPGGQVEVTDTGVSTGEAVVKVTWQAGDLSAGLLFVDVEVTLADGSQQHMEEPVVVGVRGVLSELVPE